jgi:hypothetical protein
VSAIVNAMLNGAAQTGKINLTIAGASRILNALTAREKGEKLLNPSKIETD